MRHYKHLSHSPTLSITSNPSKGVFKSPSFARFSSTTDFTTDFTTHFTTAFVLPYPSSPSPQKVSSNLHFWRAFPLVLPGQRHRCEYLYFCTSKASKVSTWRAFSITSATSSIPVCERAVDSGEKDRERGEGADGGGGRGGQTYRAERRFCFLTTRTQAHARSHTKIETKKQFDRKTGNKTVRQSRSLAHSVCSGRACVVSSSLSRQCCLARVFAAAVRMTLSF
jgi:hypothetical protein